jgi:NADH-quinone oxidoreductase subunit L
MPVTFATMSVGLLALVGVFPLAGFFSKESVLVAAEHAAQGDAEVASWVGWLVLMVAAATIAVTAVYAMRLWVLTWGGPSREAHEAPAMMTAPLVLLAVPSAAFGVLALSDSWLPTWITAEATQPAGSAEALTPELLTVVISVAAIVVGVLGFLAVRRRLLDTAARPLLTGGFGVDAAYGVLVVHPFERLVRLTSAVDSSVIGQGVSAVGDGVVAAGRAAQRVQQGDVQRYVSLAAVATLVAVVVMLVAVAT